MIEKVKQQMHFVAFLDLLGYKEFFKEKKNDVEKFLELINDALTSTIDETNLYYKRVPDAYKPKIKLFSDNILIAIKCSNNNDIDFLPYLNLVRTVAHIQKTFITKYQLFLRGGVAKGMFYFGENYVFGEALINAYEMEQLAIYPKINIDGKYVEKIINHVREQKTGNDTLANILIDVVGRERDGSYFVNYLPTYPWGSNIDENFDIVSIFNDNCKLVGQDHNDRAVETMQVHKVALMKKLFEYGNYKELFSQSSIENRKKVILKYLWVLDYHNQVCEVFGLENLKIHCNIIIDSRTLQPVVEVVDN